MLLVLTHGPKRGGVEAGPGGGGLWTYLLVPGDVVLKTMILVEMF